MIDETHDKYLMLCQLVESRLSAGAVILKTDTWNEANGCGFVSDKETHFLEINGERASKATLSGKLTVGDIRKIPYPESFFDAVLDLSTNDHIENPDKAISEYARVLKPNGALLIITWLCTKPIAPVGNPDCSDRQFWFLEEDFKSWLAPSFKIKLDFGFPEHTHPHCRLKGYLCSRM